MENSIGEVINSLRSKGSIIVNKKMANTFGVNVAILYSELLSKYKYFADRGQLTEDGYFFNTVENLQDDTNLSDHQQRETIKILRKIGLIDYRVKGLPAKRYFRPNLNIFQPFFDVLNSEQFLNNLNTDLKKNAELISKILNGNNTNSKYTNYNNTNSGNFQEEIQRPSITFEMFNEQHGPIDSDSYQKITYFLKQYEKYTGKEHPSLKSATWANAINSISNIESVYDDTEILSLDDIKLMTNHYLEKVQNNIYEATRPSISHFNNPEIKKINYYESAYYE